jgi:hypothetical protein
MRSIYIFFLDENIQYVIKIGTPKCGGKDIFSRILLNILPTQNGMEFLSSPYYIN